MTVIEMAPLPFGTPGPAEARYPVFDRLVGGLRRVHLGRIAHCGPRFAAVPISSTLLGYMKNSLATA